MSCRDAAAHFCVGVSTAIRWAAREREIGTPAAFPMGGNRPFSLAAERSWVMARLEAKPDITLRALLAELRERGVIVSYFAVWNLVHRAGKSFKKKVCTPPNRTAPTWHASVRSGKSINIRSTLDAWSLSTRPGQRPI